MGVVRFGVSLEQELLNELDEFVTNNQFSNRSQAIRQLIADYASRNKWQCNNLVIGSITLVYNHHKRDLINQLNDVQHQYHQCILASQHFHLNNNKCMEIIAVKGQAAQLTELSEKLIATKGIQHGKLTMSRAE